MANNDLHIVDTVHLDSRGKERLDSFIYGYHPDVVGVEMARNREIVGKMMRERLDSLVEGLNPKTEEERRVINEFLRYVMDDVAGFELKSIVGYTNTFPEVSLEYIDSDIVDPNGYVNLLVKNIKSFFPVDLEGKKVEDLKGILRMIVGVAYFFHEIGGKGFNSDGQDTSGMTEQDIQTLRDIYSDERNDVMASNIRGLYTGENRVLAVVGLAHLGELESD